MNSMDQYAQVIIDISLRKLDHPFTYRIPGRLQGQLRLGSLVVVPFGNADKERKGYVIGLSDVCDLPQEKIKDIAGIAMQGTDETGANAIRLAAWMQARYGGTMALCLKTVLTGRRQARPVESKTVTLLLGEEEAAQKLAFYEAKHQVARARLLQSLIETPAQPWQLIIQKLHVPAATIRAMERQGILRIDVRESFRNPVVLKQVEEARLTLSRQQQAIVDGVLSDFHAIQRGTTSLSYKSDAAAEERGCGANVAPPGERSAAANAGEDAPPTVSLIHGITGSGKTEVYISIIERIVAEGRQAIMLIPEISLTYQTLLRFYRHFGERVSVMNSTLSEAEKSDQFERARRGEIDVIIGPRSALFSPFPRLGVIVMDEEHETSYKNESMPKYHARDVAQYLAEMHGAVLVLGSATPSVDSYDRARRGEYRLYTLTKRLTGGTLASVEVADMRQELRLGNRSIVSRRLADQIEDRLERGEQTMLFLNRRGFSGFALCRSCGFVPKCPHCSVSLSIHLGREEALPAFSDTENPGKGRRLVCHYCGYEQPLPQICPECGSACIGGMNAGTEQIQDMLQKVYPKARILRMDADTTRTKGSYEKILSAFANEEADILVGTQMIVKGHDFPNVTLVGALLADMSLYAQDYCAAERTFQLLTQAAGRAGRRQRPGLVIIQTYEPSHYSIRHAAAQDYEGFYQEEMTYRRLLRYPPAAHMLSVQITSASEDHALLFAGQARELLTVLTARWEKPPLLIGPSAPAPAKLRDVYRFALYIKSEEYDKLVVCKDAVEAAAARAAAADPGFDVEFQFDFDPVVGW